MNPPVVDARPSDSSAAQGDGRPSRTAGGYFESSWELARGLDVTFRSVGTLPDEVRRELIPARPAGKA